MTATHIEKTRSPSTLAVTATSSTTSASAGDPSDHEPSEGATGTSVPGVILVSSTTPPNVTFPANPKGFVPARLLDYRGTHPKQGQLTALPGVLAELAANAAVYTSVFEPIGPPVQQLTDDLTNAGGWTNLRVAAEQFLLYAKSFEAITWKTAMADLATLNTLFNLLAEQNLQMANQFPELLKLLEVTKVIGQRGASTRSKNAKAKAAAGKTSPATSAAAENEGSAH